MNCDLAVNPLCLERNPDLSEYSQRCCRFPKSCSPYDRRPAPVSDDRAYALRQANGESLTSIIREVRRLAWDEGFQAKGDADRVWEKGSDVNPYDD